MTSIPILINGAFGRMGQITAKAIASHPAFELVGEIGKTADLKKTIQASNAKVVIDFTSPESVFLNASSIIEMGAHPVIGTTGLKPDEILTLQAQCAKLKLGGIIAPNFSLGAVLLTKYAKEIVKYMPQVEIIEKHHEGKSDCPSGTALRTAKAMAAAQTIKPAATVLHETMSGGRGANCDGIPIHAVRLPGLLAHLEIIFGGMGETLTLRHDTIDRQCFMPGVYLACQKVISLDRLVYGLEEILA